MRLVSYHNVLTLFGGFVLCSTLTGCPEKGGPGDKTSAEPERQEPDDEGKAAGEKKPAAPAAAAPAEEKKPDEEKDKGGW